MASQSDNTNIDIGNLLITTTNSLPKISSILEDNIKYSAKSKYTQLINQLYNILHQQQGEDDIKRDYDKPKDEVTLPEGQLRLPRYKEIPKEKQLTKWEKFRQEKGINKTKRSRMVFSDITQSYVPRWGKGSIKKIEDQVNWALEEKIPGENPFDKKSKEKQLKKLKQEKHEIKNKLNNNINKDNNNKKYKKSVQELNHLTQDKKNLGKELETVQKSTRSMGHFDKKLKNEKVLNMIKKKKVDKDILSNRAKERSRDKQIMNSIINNK